MGFLSTLTLTLLWLSVCETGKATNALTQHFVSSRTTASMDSDSGHLCLEGKSPPECNGTSWGCFSGAKPRHEKKGGGYGLRITGSGTDPLQLAQCAVERADTSAPERLNTHRLSYAENTLIAKTTSHAKAYRSFLLVSTFCTL